MSLSVRVYPAAEPIADLKTEVTHTAVVLTLDSAGKDALAAPRPPISSLSHLSRRGRRAGRPPPTRETEAEIAPRKNRRNAVRAVIRTRNLSLAPRTSIPSAASSQYPGGATLESADSNLAIVLAARHVFPQPRRRDLSPSSCPQVGRRRAHLELSWAISPETDIAGYNVYRSEQAGAPG